ncbi:hypothetical protein [Mesorhizobium sp. M1A.F.Ca.IN.022.07.1.1]|nr:hypothetical protein [Mesorhizobium sp. M1A.F.Ca.IN.022.07.1.1]
MTTTMISLVQDELDDAYHLAVFDCDEALAQTVRRVLRRHPENPLRPA